MIPGNANTKIVRVNDNIGAKNINKMQGTTRVLYDAVKFVTSANNVTLNFFENVNLKKFPFTNISENKLQVGETIAVQRFSFAIMNCVLNTGTVTLIKPIAYEPTFWGLYASQMSFSIAQDQVLKKIPLHTMYAPFNKNSRFFGNAVNQAVGGPMLSTEEPQDVFHLDNPIVIPPQIEFTAQLQIPPVTVTDTSDFYMVMTIEGLGSLFSPKATY